MNVFENISLTINRNDIVVVLGHNGVGKTTLFYLMMGILKPSRGRVIIAGKKVGQDKETRIFIRDHVGFVFQDPNDQLFTPTVWDDIAFGPRNQGKEKQDLDIIVDDVAKQLGITHLLDKKPHEISTGEKKLVAIATVLSINPEIIILDEPLANLDARGKQRVINTIKALNASGKTIVFSAHDTLAAADLARSALLVESNTIMKQGSCDTMLRDMLTLKENGIDANPITELFWRWQKTSMRGEKERLPITIDEAITLLRKMGEHSC
ncbi:MAG: ABC transporter ATP-binding protein [Candidatus Lokiarchaeota archaeon]|nr:ABC transporter ATP-binding protein [Candidatus Lokiarchaeota archaeon]